MVFGAKTWLRIGITILNVSHYQKSQSGSCGLTVQNNQQNETKYSELFKFGHP